MRPLLNCAGAGFISIATSTHKAAQRLRVGSEQPFLRDAEGVLAFISVAQAMPLLCLPLRNGVEPCGDGPCLAFSHHIVDELFFGYPENTGQTRCVVDR